MKLYLRRDDRVKVISLQLNERIEVNSEKYIEPAKLNGLLS